MGILFDIHNAMGPIYKEKHYVDAIEQKLIAKNVNYVREKPINLNFKNNVVCSNFIPDFIVWDSIVLDAKAKRFITNEDIRQMSRYLDQTGLPLAVVVNFKRQKLEYKRIINPKRDKNKWP